jgi:Ca2+-binding RTX toxin-like protein
MSQAITPIGTETLVNSSTSGNQEFSSVTALANGGWVIAWSGSGSGDDNGVYQQVYNADGSKRGGETLVNTTTEGFQGFSNIARLPDGGWIVAWSGSGAGFGSDDNFEVLFQVFNADGSKRGGETLINTTIAGNQSGPTIASLATGGWVVAWTGPDIGSGHPEDRGTFQQVFNADGTRKGGEVRINASTAGQQISSDVAALSDGGWVVTFTSPDSGRNDNSFDAGVYQQVFNADGSRRGPEFLVNTSTAFGDYQAAPSVTELGNGKWVVTWYRILLTGSDPSGADNHGIFQQVFNADGTRSGGEVLVNTTTNGSQQIPSVAALPNGEWVVTWAGPDLGITTGPGALEDRGIFQQVFGADGAKKGAEIRINTTTAGYQVNPKVSVLSNGEWLVTWYGNGTGDDSGVFQQRFKLGDIQVPAPSDPKPLPADLILVGTLRANKLVGGDGNDKLSGKAGKDVLTGGLGKDTFVFDTKPNKTNLDKITDYVVADDTIWLDNKYLKKLGNGSPTKPQMLNKKFFSLDKAKDSNDYIVYVKKTGALYYDEDGSGTKAAAVQIATLSKNLKGFSAAEFFVI